MFRLLVDNLGKIKYKKRDVSFSAFVKLIISQQLSSKAADTIFQRVYNHSVVEKKELDLYYRARKKLSDLYNSEKFRIQFKLEQGDLLMMDNYRLLHGRTEFDINEGNRFLQGCYIDFDSTEGKLRHIKRKFNL